MATALTGEHAIPELPFPLGMRNFAKAYASSASTDVEARGGRPSRHVPADRNLIATINDESYHGSASELPPATSHEYAKLPPEARNLHREVQALIKQAAVQQAESSASRIRQQGSARDDGGAQGPEAPVHTGGATGQPANQGRTPVRERILDTRGQAKDGDARSVINARRTGNTEAQAEAGYHPRRGGRYDSREDRSPTPEPLGTRVFSREIRTASFPQRFRQPTSIDKYTGETDPRV
jgi:hypothetical protein